MYEIYVQYINTHKQGRRDRKLNNFEHSQVREFFARKGFENSVPIDWKYIIKAEGARHHHIVFVTSVMCTYVDSKQDREKKFRLQCILEATVLYYYYFYYYYNSYSFYN
jgi:hypothetical protein